MINYPTFENVDNGILPESTYLGRAWGKKPLVCFQHADGPDSLNPKGWDMQSAGIGAFSSAGFGEWPVPRGSEGHKCLKEYKISDIMIVKQLDS